MRGAMCCKSGVQVVGKWEMGDGEKGARALRGCGHDGEAPGMCTLQRVA